ncbi:MAG: DUF2834 domain-containing protein [Deltaproteobacteria bacterium]|nr:DUF2834 domain-containing protein [Deltaproteobacteria bacterium]MBW2394552.1 DUF2834 domain-containing protein [Deltaproteobacteria bacterium]
MTRIAALSLALVGFLVLTDIAILELGYVGFFEAMLANAGTRLAMVDLSIVLILFTIWQWNDARERALPFWPYAVLSLTIGAAGPLAYLIHRTSREERKAPSAA